MSEIHERQIALDTETTGLVVEEGHRIIQIACVEIVNRKMTGNDYCQLIDPERESDAEAVKVHRITAADLSGKPKFKDVWEQIRDYVSGATVVIHNAEFDLAFLNAELQLLGGGSFVEETQCEIVDTLKMARKRYPGASNNLDALCTRYNISLASRDEAHRADVDAKLLASVYLALTSGQEDFDLSAVAGQRAEDTDWGNVPVKVQRANDAEMQAHNDFLDMLDEKSGSTCVWRQKP